MADRIPHERLERFAADVLVAVGVGRDHAEITAKRLVEADLRGRTGHGLIRLGPYVDRIEAGGINLQPDIQVRHETPVSALVDGDNALGQVVMSRATELAIAKAEDQGMAWVGTVHSNHAGAAGLYPAMAMRRGLIGLYFAVANANGMPPWGGVERILGTNPIAVAIPAADGDGFQLDIATTVASHGTIKVVAQAGEQMPEGWVVDEEGDPITDPAEAHRGFLVPIGGYKGSGLNIMIGLLAGVLNGAAFLDTVIDHRVQVDTPTNTGQAILVMRPDLFRPREEVLSSLGEHIARLRQSKTQSGEPVRLPGDGAVAADAENRKSGLELPDALRGSLELLGNRLGVEPLS